MLARAAVLAGLCRFLAAPAALAAQTSDVTLVAEGSARDTVTVRAGAYQQRFTIAQVGADSGTYQVTCAALGSVRCAVDTTATVRIAPGGRTELTVDYRATRTGQGLVVLRVRDIRSGARASAGLLVTVLGS